MSNKDKIITELLEKTQQMQEHMELQEKTIQILLKSNKQIIDWVDDIVKDQKHFRENYFFEISDPRLKEETTEYWYPDIVSVEETLNEIINHGKSIARFGDGEFATIYGRVRHKFQTEQDDRLAARLLDVLASEDDSLMVAIADNYGNLERYSEQAKREIRFYLTRQVRKEHLQILKRDRKYYNAYVTRPYVMYNDSKTDCPQNRFENLKKIWADRKCVFIEGKYTALGVGNDLFSGAESIQRIIGPAENAFHAYDKILESCKNQAKDKLFLLALGPTATVLAYDLCKMGYQAVDIGHIDLEYEWFLKGQGCRTEIVGKYNNELAGGDKPVEIKDKQYQSQIMADFS